MVNTSQGLRREGLLTDGVHKCTKGRAAHNNSGHESLAIVEVKLDDKTTREEDQSQANTHKQALNEEQLNGYVS